jgi:hypothetical protein
MKIPEWPGIATVVGIILIVMISFDLSKWQTLTAAIIAFGGGVLAYRGAMAKIAQDAAEHKREFLRRQLGLYLKLDIATRRLRPAAQIVDASISFLDEAEGVSVEALKIEEPPEIAEVWDNLDVFPRRLIREIASIREHIRRIDDVLDGLPNDKRLYGGGNHKGTQLRFIDESLRAIVDACGLIYDGLAPEIEQLAPNLPEQQRMIALYGDPDFDDD